MLDRGIKLRIIATLLRRNRPDLANAVAETFQDLFGAKNKWVKMSAGELSKHPELANELFELLSIAYKPIGGHAKIRKPQDLFGGDLSFQVIDIDEDPDPDAFKMAKDRGRKSAGMGHDGSGPAKKVVIKKSADDLKISGNYAEMSGAIAHIMLTRFGIASVDDQEAVQKVLKGKKIEWVGEHPSGKYPNNKGWYSRGIGGKKHMKILLGLPLGR